MNTTLLNLSSKLSSIIYNIVKVYFGIIFIINTILFYQKTIQH